MESTGCASISNLNFIRNRIHNCFDRRDQSETRWVPFESTTRGGRDRSSVFCESGGASVVTSFAALLMMI
ncbi:hypothetical protein DVH24_033623 [Malus domestica]|uniref:Uncharacterized protein n=1 Tax=Malus domestica TaxID=3750 RepID=A0A498KQ48_MALDO|nr:hypothetical protein DVH24_033623 [Malus domestica]